MRYIHAILALGSELDVPLAGHLPFKLVSVFGIQNAINTKGTSLLLQMSALRCMCSFHFDDQLWSHNLVLWKEAKGDNVRQQKQTV